MGKFLYCIYLSYILIQLYTNAERYNNVNNNEESVCVFSLYSLQCKNATNNHYEQIIQNGVSHEMKIIKCKHCELNVLEEYMFSKNPKWSLNLQNIEIIDNKNPLKLIETPFRGLNNLEWLKLYNSQISEINSSTFEGIPNLKYLFLQNNNLTILPARVFSDCENLIKINLNFNQIRVIHKNAFRNLHALKELLLSGNDIKRIKDGTFKHLTSIQALDLSLNPFLKLNFIQLHDNIPSAEIIKLQNIPCSTLLDVLFKNIRNNYDIKTYAENCDQESCLFVKIMKRHSKQCVIISILKNVELNSISTTERIGDIPCRRYKNS